MANPKDDKKARTKNIAKSSQSSGIVTSKTKCTKSGCYNETQTTKVKKQKTSSEDGKSQAQKNMRAGAKKVKKSQKAAKQRSKQAAKKREQDQALYNSKGGAALGADRPYNRYRN